MYILKIFNNLYRGFGLPFSNDSIMLGISGSSACSHMSKMFTYSSTAVQSLATWIVSMIGSGEDRDLCMKYIKKLFLSLRSFYYPSNSGNWSVSLNLYLINLKLFTHFLLITFLGKSFPISKIYAGIFD